MKHATKIKLGSEVICIDPCYDDAALGVKLSVIPGSYYCYVSRAEDERIASISVRHVDHTDVAIDLEYTPSGIDTNSYVGVDSGQAGIIDFESWQSKVGQSKDESVTESWYRQACFHTLSRLQYGIMNDGDRNWRDAAHGFVSSSGYGDGCYRVYVAKNGSDIVGIRIESIYPDKNEETFEESIVP
jgi:hypothetical protein